MKTNVVKKIFNSMLPDEKSLKNWIKELSPYSFAHVQITSLGLLHKSFKFSPNHSLFFSPISSSEVRLSISLLDLNQSDLHKSILKIEEKRKRQREIDQNTEDFQIFMEELTFAKVHGRFK